MQTQELLHYLNGLLEPWRYKDYAPNGLQVEGRADIQRLICGVSASQALLDAALERQGDAILVHHGYFWKNEDGCITGMQRRRLKTLLANDLNLLAYHCRWTVTHSWAITLNWRTRSVSWRKDKRASTIYSGMAYWPRRVAPTSGAMICRAAWGVMRCCWDARTRPSGVSPGAVAEHKACLAPRLRWGWMPSSRARSASKITIWR